MTRQLALPLGFDPDQDFRQYSAGRNLEVVTHLSDAATAAGPATLLLWGPEGSGKTHLLNACCALAHGRQRGTAYLPLGQLHPHGPAILEGLEYLEVVSLDDLDQVAGNPEWETGLFNLFNRLRERQGVWIASAAMPPQQLPFRLPDLISRLSWGMTLRLHPLGDEDILQALSLRARAKGLDLPPAVGRYLFTHARRDLPALLKLLDQLDRASLEAQRKLTIPFVKSQLGDTA
jgi:DnaA family protein